MPPSWSQGGWSTWSGVVEAESGVVSNAVAARGSQSLSIVAGNDTTKIFSGITSRLWTVKANVFVPAAQTGTLYFILLNNFVEGQNWAAQIAMSATAGTVKSEEGGGTLPIVMDAWAQIEVTIDLAANRHKILYNGATLRDWAQWAADATPVGTRVHGSVERRHDRSVLQ